MRIDIKLLGRFWAKVNKTHGCWLWAAARRGRGKDYGGFRLNNHNYLAHRLTWEIVHGPIPESLCVLHKCDTPLCVRPGHLFLGTDKDNSDDMIRKGRRALPRRGELNGHSKLTWTMVKKIRQLHAVGGIRQRDTARKFGISQAQVNNIVRGKQWVEW